MINCSQSKVTRPGTRYGNDFLRPFVLVGEQRNDVNDHDDHDDPADHGKSLPQFFVTCPARSGAEEYQEVKSRFY